MPRFRFFHDIERGHHLSICIESPVATFYLLADMLGLHLAYQWRGGALLGVMAEMKKKGVAGSNDSTTISGTAQT